MKDMLLNVGSGGGAAAAPTGGAGGGATAEAPAEQAKEEKKEEGIPSSQTYYMNECADAIALLEKEESDEDMGFGLFD